MDAVKDICRTICYYRRRETNSFFLFLQRNKDTHQFKSAGLLDLTFSLSDAKVVKVCSSPTLVHSSYIGRRHPSRGILGNLAWPGNVPMVSGWRQDPLLFTAHLAPLHPDTHTIYEDNRRARLAPLKHSLMDVHGAWRGERERVRGRQGESGRQRLRSGCLTVFITVN